jgi:beta-galactosidase
MIRQNYNHPSVVLWCYMNEVLLKPHFTANSDRQKTYIANITKLAKRLDSLTRKEDPYRPTMIAHHGDLNKYADAGLVDIPAVVGWNLYSGWYGGDTTGFPRFLDAFHKRYPHKPMLVTEYGADADPRIHSHAPVRFDKSVEYTTLFHQYYLSQIRSRPFVAGGVVWNLADFNSESRTESMPHINNKGLLQWNRTPKDPWYFYEAALQRNPVTRILASENKRTGFPDRNNVCLQPLMVASNSDTVEVFLNGASLGKKVVQNYLCQWMIPFTGGSNELKAIGWHKTAVSEDAASINFRMQPEVLQTASFTFQPLNILMSSSRYYTDEEHTLWQPTREYQSGRWGSVGGRAFRIDSNSRLPFGTDRNILQTADDPLYQTQWVGIQQYRLDVPPGTYQLTLYFAELQGGSVPPLPYNLVAAGRTEPGAARVFDVLVNDRPFLKNFNLAADYGIAVPVRKTVSVAVSRGEGIVVSFHPITGEPVLNALEVKKEN